MGPFGTGGGFDRLALRRVQVLKHYIAGPEGIGGLAAARPKADRRQQ
jgi:hypothetical protein